EAVGRQADPYRPARDVGRGIDRRHGSRDEVADERDPRDALPEGRAGDQTHDDEGAEPFGSSHHRLLSKRVLMLSRTLHGPRRRTVAPGLAISGEVHPGVLYLGLPDPGSAGALAGLSSSEKNPAIASSISIIFPVMPRRAPSPQLSLFEEEAAPPPPAGVLPAPPDPDLVALGARIPGNVFLGGSTWSFPGWAGTVYDREYKESKLAREGLSAYAQHPLLSAIGIDRTHYQTLPSEDFAAYAAQVPERFRFLVKAHEEVTLWRFPDRPRYGSRRGQGNPRFLDPAYAAERVVAPAVAGLGGKLGAIVFEFAPQDLGKPAHFAADLAAFLTELPRGPVYAVELRNRELLTSEYAAALAAAGACHCYNVHPRMPELPVQRQAVPPGPKTIIRWLVARSMTYEESARRFLPFDRLRQEDPEERRAVAGLLREAVADSREALATVNNNAEGCAPLSIEKLALELAGGA